MPYDPTLPIPGAIVDADQLRAQFNGLNDKINTLPHVTPAELSAAISGTAVNPSGVGPFTGGFSDPPTASELWALVSWIDQIRTAVTRT